MSIALQAPVQGHTGASSGFPGDALSDWVADDFLGNDNRGEFWRTRRRDPGCTLKINADKVAADPVTAGHYGRLNGGAVSDAEYDRTRLPDPLTVTCCLTAATAAWCG
jgi:hypothetical protein